MKIWIDADACPRDAKELVFRAAKRLQILALLVANSPMRIPQSTWIQLEIVGKAFNEADDYIADHVAAADLVITADIPLAARVVDRGTIAIDPRGHIYHEENVKDRLATRNLLADLRDVGLSGGGPAPYGAKDRAKFAAALNQLLTKMMAGS